MRKIKIQSQTFWALLEFRWNAFRLAKINKDKNRPIKVILQSDEDALTVLKNKSKISVEGIRVGNDMTKMQQEYFKNELNDNSKTIKFVKGKPTIVKVTTAAKNQ